MLDIIVLIDLDEIFSDDEFNCRGFITAASVQDLARDIARLGLLLPIIVQPWQDKNNPKIKYRIVCGHRRFLAMKLNNKKGLPNSSSIKAIVYTNLTKEEAFVLNVSENIKRENLNILQEAEAIKRFYDLGWSEDRIADELKVLKAWVQVRVTLLRLPEPIQKRAAAEMLTQHQILEIFKLPNKEDQLAACRAAIDWKLKGNRGSLKPKKPGRVLKEKSIYQVGQARDRVNIGLMQEAIQAVLGNDHISARTLAWAAGFISSADLGENIQELAAKKGKLFKLPTE